MLQQNSISCILFRWCVMLSVRASEISFGSAGLWSGVWCGTTLSVLTAHLSHFVSHSIHLHGPISSHDAGGWCASMFIFVLKPRKYTKTLVQCQKGRLCMIIHCWKKQKKKKASLFNVHSHRLFWVTVDMLCHIGFISGSTAHDTRTLDFFWFS